MWPCPEFGEGLLEAIEGPRGVAGLGTAPMDGAQEALDARGGAIAEEEDEKRVGQRHDRLELLAWRPLSHPHALDPQHMLMKADRLISQPATIPPKRLDSQESDGLS